MDQSSQQPFFDGIGPRFDTYLKKQMDMDKPNWYWISELKLFFWNPEQSFRLLSLFVWLMNTPRHGMNPCMIMIPGDHSKERELFDLKYRMMRKYFGLASPTATNWTLLANIIWVSLEDDELQRRIQEGSRRLFPDYENYIQPMQRVGMITGKDDVYVKQSSNEDLVSKMIRQITMLGEGDFEQGVYAFERMENGASFTIEMKVVVEKDDS